MLSVWAAERRVSVCHKSPCKTRFWNIRPDVCYGLLLSCLVTIICVSYSSTHNAVLPLSAYIGHFSTRQGGFNAGNRTGDTKHAHAFGWQGANECSRQLKSVSCVFCKGLRWCQVWHAVRVTYHKLAPGFGEFADTRVSRCVRLSVLTTVVLSRRRSLVYWRLNHWLTGREKNHNSLTQLLWRSLTLCHRCAQDTFPFSGGALLSNITNESNRSHLRRLSVWHELLFLYDGMQTYILFPPVLQSFVK